jgi:hypothetical protein
LQRKGIRGAVVCASVVEIRDSSGDALTAQYRLVTATAHVIIGHHAAATRRCCAGSGRQCRRCQVAAGLVLGVVQCDIVNVAGARRDPQWQSGSVVTIDGLGVWPGPHQRDISATHGVSQGCCGSAARSRIVVGRWSASAR